jgi:aspartyl protease family protein
MEAAIKQYETLAADPSVKAALLRINESALPKVKLGPSAQLTQELPAIRKERETVSSGVIKFAIDSGVPQVQVTLNGRVTQLMVVDSGASVVTLSWDVANRLDLLANPKGPTVPLKTAEGKIVQARLVMLDSVRVGSFVVKDIDAVVMPKNVPGSQLLGGSFLRNFVYRMDLGAGELHLTQLSGKSKPGELAKSSNAPDEAAPPGTTGAPRGPATAPASADGDGWTVLFRSARPAEWNTTVNAADAYAIPLDRAPSDTRYLRMRNSAGDFVIIELSFAELRKKVVGEKYGWEGRDYEGNNGFHLGIIDKKMPRAGTGSIDVTQRPGSGWTGYGFGNRVNKDDRQGYVWAGKPVEKAGYEIAVTGRNLTNAEKQKLLSE